MIVGHVEKRMAKAYPVIMEKTEQIEKEGNFAEGCGFYKLFWLFLIGAVLGDFTETIFCRLTAGVWMSRSSLVWDRQYCMGAGDCHCNGTFIQGQRKAGPAYFYCRYIFRRSI